jgi:type IV secretion system protein VirB6
MEAFFNFFTDADNYFTTINSKIISETWGAFAANRPFFTTMFALILIVYFLRVALGLQRNSIEGVAWNVLMMTFAFTAFVSWNDIYPEIRTALLEGPQDIGLAIVNKVSSSGTVSSFGDALRDITQKGTQLASTISAKVNTGFVGPIIAFLIVFIMGVAIVFMVFAITAVLLFAKFLTALMLALTPLAVIPLFFQSLSFLFQGWLRVLIGGLVMQLIAYVVVGVLVVFMSDFIEKAQAAGSPSGDSAIWVVFGFLLYGAFVVLFAILVPVITNAIITGTGIQTAIGRVVGGVALAPAAAMSRGVSNSAATMRDKAIQSTIERGAASGASATSVAGARLARGIRASMGRSPSLYRNRSPSS